MTLVEPALLLVSGGKGKKEGRESHQCHCTANKSSSLLMPSGMTYLQPQIWASSTMMHNRGAGPTLPSADPASSSTLKPFIITSGPAFLPAVGNQK